MRVLALSDVHADFEPNRRWLTQISDVDHQEDVLLLAGDVTDKLDLLEQTLGSLRRKFAQLFFVPGNHELWDRETLYADAITKFEVILARCANLDIRTEPRTIGHVRIVPLFSWYTRPEEGADSLYVEKKSEDITLTGWADDYLVRWPDFPHVGGAAAHFLARNEAHLQPIDDIPTISFSHFVPRRDLLMRTATEIQSQGAGTPDPNPHFNFSRVAGTNALERQIRVLRSAVHVYGHQHRNRWREIDGIVYASHCLGYPAERKRMPSAAIDGPLVVWED